jgi:enamine deaminase RidA (YjgF/YER057c/UK114 family)
MKNRTNISSGAKWEVIVGYSRLVKVNNQVYVTGTVAIDDQGNVVGEGNAYEQAKYIIQKVEKILAKVGAKLEDVVRTRMFVTDISRWEEYGRAHGEFFGEIKPATTMVEVSKLIDDGFLIEIEFEAILEEGK